MEVTHKNLSHAVVWIDHQEAHVIQFNADEHENATVSTRSKYGHLHQKAGVIGSGHHVADQTYLHEVVEAVASANEILIVGPSSAKLELMKHMVKHDANIASKVVGIETVDHPSDAQLLAYAKKSFTRIDHLKPQR
ncbi:MAG: translational machinery protein [Methylophilaceae bacterium]|nr:translational machinery protein [Methylophilaceae bacterium]